MWDEKGRASETISQAVTVAPPQAPLASFVISPTGVAPSQTVYLNASSSTPGTGRTITTYAWDFGNGATGRGVTTTTSYSAAGTYTITLVVTDDVGQTSTRSSTVSVTSSTAAAPSASFVYSPTAPSTGQNILFDASTSTAATGHSITSYAWTFGDGSTGTGRTYTKTGGYTTAATYNVVLTVTDDLGQTATKATAVAIAGGGSATPTPPTAAFTFSPTAPAVNEAVYFNASTSAASTGHTISSYAWTFGDGAVSTGTTATTNHTYTQAATYTVMLTVTDDLGQTKSASNTVTVGGASVPVASFSTSNDGCTGACTIYVDASTSTTSVGQTITNYEWNFGDGSAIVSTATRYTSHGYPAGAASYTITLTITDSIGRKAATTKSVTIK